MREVTHHLVIEVDEIRAVPPMVQIRATDEFGRPALQSISIGTNTKAFDYAKSEIWDLLYRFFEELRP